MDRFAVCTSLLGHFKFKPLLERIVTGDEKWILGNGTREEKDDNLNEIPNPKLNLHQK